MTVDGTTGPANRAQQGEGRGNESVHISTHVRYIYTYVCTVHDTENLTFSEEFRGCSARNDADFPHGCRGISARVPRNFRAGGRGSSVRAGADLPRRRARIFRADSV